MIDGSIDPAERERSAAAAARQRFREARTALACLKLVAAGAEPRAALLAVLRGRARAQGAPDKPAPLPTALIETTVALYGVEQVRRADWRRLCCMAVCPDPEMAAGRGGLLWALLSADAEIRRRALAQPDADPRVTLTARLCGDPAPGRSAADGWRGPDEERRDRRTHGRPVRVAV